MKKYFFILIHYLFVGCNQPPNIKSVTFTIEGLIIDNHTIKNEFGDKYKNDLSIVEIYNNIDSIIYVPTDSAHILLLPCFHGYINENGQGEERANVHADILRYSYIDIAPHSSRRFVTNIHFVPSPSNSYKRISLTYPYTMKYQGDSTSWMFIKKQFEHDAKFHFTPSQ
jgi:hypothetical protein